MPPRRVGAPENDALGVVVDGGDGAVNLISPVAVNVNGVPVSSTAHNHSGAYVAVLGPVITVDPRIGATYAATSANRCLFTRVTQGGTISKIGVEIGTASGNISAAVYANTGTGRAAAPTGAPLATSGAVACPASGYAEVALGASVAVAAGDWLALTVDNATVTFLRHGHPAGTALLNGWAYRQDTAHPAPTVGALGVTGNVPVLIGVP